jgi:hypothetical protein
MAVSGAMALAWAASVMIVPALPAIAPRGATYTTIGALLSSMALTILSIKSIWPPGVLSWMMSTSAFCVSAVAMPRSM